MEPKQRLFIYDRKEMGVLTLLGVMIALFAFTLGVHLGKKAGPKVVAEAPHDASTVPTVGDKVPERHELTDLNKNLSPVVDESLDQTLHDEVVRMGVKLDQPRQVELPDKPKSENAGNTTLGENTAPKHDTSTVLAHPKTLPPSVHEAAPPSTPEPSALARSAPAGKYTLQIASFPNMEEAKEHIDSLEKLGVKPFARFVELGQKGKWYRVYLGGFETKEEADAAGARYKEKNQIRTFIVANRVE